MEIAKRNIQGFPSKRTAQRFVQFYEKLKEYKAFIYSSESVSFLLNNIDKFAKYLKTDEELSNFFKTFADIVEEQLVEEEERDKIQETATRPTQVDQSPSTQSTQATTQEIKAPSKKSNMNKPEIPELENGVKNMDIKK